MVVKEYQITYKHRLTNAKVFSTMHGVGDYPAAIKMVAVFARRHVPEDFKFSRIDLIRTIIEEGIV